jgi:hypothetical protein
MGDLAEPPISEAIGLHGCATKLFQTLPLWYN